MRRRNGHLGRSARQRERSGAIELSYTVVNDTVKAFATSFVACGLSPSSDFVSPPPKPPRPRRIRIRDAETGTERPADVFMISDPASQSPVHGYNETYMRPGAVRYDRIVLKVKPDLCMPTADWTEAMRGVLTHEVAHATDPGMPRYRRPRPTAESERCEYLNNPSEVTAFIAQVRQEITSFNAVWQAEELRRKRGVVTTPAEALRLFSPTYGRMYNCLRPKTKRRFLRMAARVWSP
jgi:hypothetical protein